MSAKAGSKVKWANKAIGHHDRRRWKNAVKTKQNKTKQNKMKRNETKRKETKRYKTKQNKTKDQSDANGLTDKYDKLYLLI